jgi:hypothetical protein
MSTPNELLSQFDPETPLTADQLPPHDNDLFVSNGKLHVTQSTGVTRDLGSFLVAQAVYIVDAYINAQGNAVLILSDDQEIELGKVTTDQVVQMKAQGEGILQSIAGDTLQFSPITVPPGLQIKNGAVSQLPHFFDLSKYSLFDDRTTGAAGRYFVAENIRALKPQINNLNLQMDGNYIILPPGTYYLSGFTQAYVADIIVSKILRKTGGHLLWGHPIMTGTHTGSQQPTNPAFVKGRVVLTEETRIALSTTGAASLVHTNNYGLGISWTTLNANVPNNIWCQLEIWRLD